MELTKRIADDLWKENKALRALLRRMVENCGRCAGVGMIWEKNNNTRPISDLAEYRQGPCPYCSEARKMLGMGEGK